MNGLTAYKLGIAAKMFNYRNNLLNINTCNTGFYNLF